MLQRLVDDGTPHILAKGIIGSATALLVTSIFNQKGKQQHIVVLPDKEQAAYFYNDVENLLDESDSDLNQKKVLYYPTSYKRPYEPETVDRAYQLSRTEVLKRTISGDKKTIIVTYSEALAEKVITKKYLSKNLMKLRKGEEVSLDFISDLLFELDFEHVDFVAEPGQFAIRGGIIDVFSFSNEHPYRIEFFGDEVESIRTFNPSTQLSLNQLQRITLLPNVQNREIREERVDFLDFIPSSTVIWFDNIDYTIDSIENEYEKALAGFAKLKANEISNNPEILFSDSKSFRNHISGFSTVEFSNESYFKDVSTITFNQKPQPSFNKNFELLINDIKKQSLAGFKCLIFSNNQKQIERLYAIFEDMQVEISDKDKAHFTPVNHSLSNGFIDNELKLLCYTDHQIFNRYHKFKLREGFGNNEVILIKELYNLNPGDYVTHIDHGVGRFDGLQTIDNNGKKQEAIRLIYKNNDILYVSIHSLHRISKYVGKEGTPSQS